MDQDLDAAPDMPPGGGSEGAVAVDDAPSPEQS
jgi:hypothetical protein